MTLAKTPHLKLSCVRRLLKRADYRPGPDFCGEGRLQIKWEGSDPSSNPSTTMKRVQHG